jgi:DNA-binding HxlR family transcriptional regulator
MEKMPGSNKSEFEELKKRVGTLEKRVASLTKAEGGRQIMRKGAPLQEDDLMLLERLRARKGKRYGRDALASGVIAYAGAATISHKATLWIREHPVPEILQSDPDTVARILMALGNQSRIAIVIELIQRPRSAPELQELLKISSTGQLYHHLKELLSAGIISQPKRSTYEVNQHKLIPLLNILGTTADFFLDYSESKMSQVKQK